MKYRFQHVSTKEVLEFDEDHRATILRGSSKYRELQATDKAEPARTNARGNTMPRPEPVAAALPEVTVTRKGDTLSIDVPSSSDDRYEISGEALDLIGTRIRELSQPAFTASSGTASAAPTYVSETVKPKRKSTPRKR